jgi:hypothetical protein
MQGRIGNHSTASGRYGTAKLAPRFECSYADVASDGRECVTFA